jgi:predicted Co/Zn/Cd cation transporter (cation efflux family)
VSVKAIDYFLHGIGEEMLLGPVIPYEIVMVILCIALSLFYRHQNKRINNTSTMLKAETKTTLVDGIMSGGIGVSALIVSFIDGSSPLYFLRYTGDFFITIILVLFSIRVPVKVLMKSFIELANGVVTDEKIKRSIEQVIRKHLPMDTELKNCDIYKTGMSLRIFVYLDDHIDILCLNALREKMQHMKKELSVEYENISICFAITTPN